MSDMDLLVTVALNAFDAFLFLACLTLFKITMCCSKRRFDEQQAEDWWNKNKDRLLKRYNPSTSSSTPTGSPKTQPSTEESNEVPSASKVDL